MSMEHNESDYIYDDADLNVDFDSDLLAGPDASEFKKPRRTIKKISRPENRVLSDVLSITELGRILSLRASMINKDGEYFVDASDLDNAIDIAKRELKERRCIMKIEREVGREYNRAEQTETIFVEIWYPAELIFPREFWDV